MRIGAKKRPFYRVVVVDERSKRTGAYIELLGTYNPLTEPKDIKLKQDRIDHWIKQGAQMSNGFLRIIGKAPQRPPRKAKKEKKEEKPSDKTEEAATTSEVKPEASADTDTSEVSQTEEVKEKQIATEPSAPHNDEKEESESKDEGSA